MRIILLCLCLYFSYCNTNLQFSALAKLNHIQQNRNIPTKNHKKHKHSKHKTEYRNKGKHWHKKEDNITKNKHHKHKSSIAPKLSCTYKAKDTFNPFNYRIIKQASGKNGAVVSAHPLASKAGLQMLQEGGNAVDAAIAMQLALAVVYPVAGNLGGGGFMLLHNNDGKTLILDFREQAPLKSNPTMYAKDSTYNRSQEGPLAVGVPGTVAGIFAALPYAKLPIKTLIKPAIKLAKHGFAITQQEADRLNKYKNKFLQHNLYTPVFVKPNKWKKGDTLIQIELAHTLKLIRDSGLQGFYAGSIAQKITNCMRLQHGLIDQADLQAYQVKTREALKFQYNQQYTLLTMPPPSSGGIVIAQILQMLNIMKHKLPTPLSLQNPLVIQFLVEAERRAYADRASYMADPDFYKVPITALMDSNYLFQRIQSYIPRLASSNAQIKEGQLNNNSPESEETTHLNAADKWGNIVSLTTTLNGPYGSFVIPQGTGVLLNNEMDDFTTHPGKPNMYGAVDGNNNLPAPSKRMLSSMSPSIILKNGKAFLAVGTPGGTTIPTSVLQTILNIIESNLSEKDALAMPRFHFQRIPDTIFVEQNYSEKLIQQLIKYGYKVKKRRGLGKVETIKILPDSTLRASADERGDDSALAF